MDTLIICFYVPVFPVPVIPPPYRCGGNRGKIPAVPKSPKTGIAGKRERPYLLGKILIKSLIKAGSKQI